MKPYTSTYSDFTFTPDVIPESFTQGMNECLSGITISLDRVLGVPYEDFKRAAERLEPDNFV